MVQLDDITAAFLEEHAKHKFNLYKGLSEPAVRSFNSDDVTTVAQHVAHDAEGLRALIEAVHHTGALDERRRVRARIVEMKIMYDNWITKEQNTKDERVVDSAIAISTLLSVLGDVL